MFNTYTGSLRCYLPHVDFFSVWLCWVLIALHELSLVVTSGGYSCSEQASHWGGFCCCWAKTSVVVACRLRSCGARLSCSVACGIFPDQGLNQTSVSCLGRQIFIHCTTREVLVLYYHLLFFLWIKILHSTYYTLLLTIISRNWDRRRNEGNRIKPPICWAGSFPFPIPPGWATASLNQIQHQRCVLEWWGLGQVSRRGNLGYTQAEWNQFMNTLPGYHFQTQKWS